MASFQKYQTKDGWKWLFKVDLPPDPLTGKRRQTTRRGFKTKKEAQKAATELLMQAEKGVEVINQNMTLEEYLDKWVDLSAKRKVRETTLKNYLRAINHRIKPVLGKHQLNKITPAQCQEFINRLQDEGLSKDTLSTFIQFYMALYKKLLSGI